MNANTKWYVGLVATVLVALGQQVHALQLPEPWNHLLTIGGIVGSAVSGYMIQRPVPPSGGQ